MVEVIQEFTRRQNTRGDMIYAFRRAWEKPGYYGVHMMRPKAEKINIK